jgi:TPR repeat protein
MRRLMLGVMLACGVLTSVTAGPFEEAKAAYARKDYANAIRIWRAMAEQGDAEAQFRLGYMYIRGQGISKDLDKGMELIFEAADRGGVSAMTFVASALSAKDPEKAEKWWRKAADLGDALAQLNLGMYFEQGLGGVPRDYEEAARWYRKAAEQGNPVAQYSLGLIYQNGRQGVPIDFAEAMKWHRTAADQGYAPSQSSLGAMYGVGQGVPQDYAESLKWFRKAADLGDALAQSGLGQMYELGQAVPQDYVQAHKWFNLAASRETDTGRRDLFARRRDIIAAKMTPAKVAEAQRLAREWKPK